MVEMTLRGVNFHLATQGQQTKKSLVWERLNNDKKISIFKRHLITGSVFRRFLKGPTSHVTYNLKVEHVRAKDLIYLVWHNIFIEFFFYKFIVLFDRYKGVSPYLAKNDTEKMVDTINKNDIRR